MPERREPRFDGAAWVLLLCGLCVALCVFSDDPGGTPNLLGPPGAWLARQLAQALGSAVHILFACWFVLVLMLLVRRGWLRWAARLLGWLILLPCAAIATDWLGPTWVGGPLTGSGGAIGAWLRALLLDALPLPAAIAVFAAASVVGILLALDVVVRGVCVALYYVCVALSWLLAVIAGRAEAWNAAWQERRAAQRKKRAGPFDIPIVHSRHADVAEAAAPVEPAALAEDAEAADEPPRILPIVRTPEVPLEDERSFADYELPPLTLLDEPEPFPFDEHDQKLREQAALLEQTFKDFDLNVRVVGINTGPVITQYEVALETGMRVNKITTLADDLALHLSVPSVRVVAPIPGKNTVGIEVPNEHRAVVRLKEVILGAARRVAKAKVPLFLGKDSEGRPLVYDLADMPHLLIAGTTGTGKSVCLNAIILSMLMTRRPDEIKLLLIDPKMTELTEYGKIPHLMHPVVNDVKKSEAILAWAVDKMEERYDILSRARVRHVSRRTTSWAWTKSAGACSPTKRKRDRIPERMPYIVIVVDELADLMMQMKREVEGHIIRLAQKSRAAGIHLVLATQKPTVDVITGLIKSNLPGRTCFKVASRIGQPGRARRDGRREAARQGRHAVPPAGHERPVACPGHLCERSGNQPRHRAPGVRGAVLRRGAGAAQGDRRRQARSRRCGARSPVRTGDRDRRARRPRQRVAIAAGAGHRLRPGGPVDRLHGGGRHRRGVQRIERARGAVHAGGVGRAEAG